MALVKKHINVIGAGLAGCEAAWQIASRGQKVRLYEMKPFKKSPAHHSDGFAELVCSNSLRAAQTENAVGLLKAEMRLLNSLIMNCADRTAVPAGGALAVDRDAFSEEVTRIIRNHKNISVVHAEISELKPEEPYIIATGPLTSDRMCETIEKLIGYNRLYFFDAAAPVVSASSIDMNKVYRASRYGKGSDDYINCPMNQDEYIRFHTELVKAMTIELKGFEKSGVFEGCMPVEVMAGRGVDTLRFGPMKPVGLPDPKTGKEPYAVVQLRTENAGFTLFNLVGFQTNLKFGEQKRVFGLIPGLENAEFMRYGVMHRNTYINSPGLIDSTYRLKSNANIYFAGQITGVEGYVESASSGLTAGINTALRNRNPDNSAIFPPNTSIGALAEYVSSSESRNFQPMNVNFGIFKDINIPKVKSKKDRNSAIAEESLKIIAIMADRLKYRRGH